MLCNHNNLEPLPNAMFTYKCKDCGMIIVIRKCEPYCFKNCYRK